GPLDVGAAHGFPRRNHAKLREAVQQSNLLFVEVAQWIIAVDLGAVLKPQLSAIHGLDGTDARAPFEHGPPEVAPVVSQRRNYTDAGDGAAALHIRLEPPLDLPVRRCRAVWRFRR